MLYTVWNLLNERIFDVPIGGQGYHLNVTWLALLATLTLVFLWGKLTR